MSIGRRRCLWLGVGLALVALGAGPPTASATTTFSGQYLCNDRGVVKPLAGARVYLNGTVAPEELAINELDATGSFGPGGFTGPNGEWSFTVPSYNVHINYHPVLVLSDAQDRFNVGDHPDTGPWTRSGDENQDDRPVQAYAPEVISDRECAVFLGFKHAYDDYARITGRPSGRLHVDFGAPVESAPVVDILRVKWPSFDIEPPGSESEEFRVFAHLIHNRALLGGPADAGRRVFIDQPARACHRSDPERAFDYGFAEFWAGDFLPAPNCPGISPNDEAVEGNVAARLTQMNRGCTVASRWNMVKTLIRYGTTIH